MADAWVDDVQPRRSGGKAPEAFRTISEVAEELNLPQHVLRFWETRFPQIRPLKRGGGRRYYRPEDIALLRSIRGLLYDDGYTIKGVQKLIRGGGVRSLLETAGSEPDEAPTKAVEPAPQVRAGPDPYKEALLALLDELEEIRALLAAKD
jgi:DNA-binding transcriptional MerR regulator